MRVLFIVLYIMEKQPQNFDSYNYRNKTAEFLKSIPDHKERKDSLELIRNTEPYIRAYKEKSLKRFEGHRLYSFQNALDVFKKKKEIFEKSERLSEDEKEEIISLAMEARKHLDTAQDKISEQLDEIEDEQEKQKLKRMIESIKIFDEYYSYLYDRGVRVITPGEFMEKDRPASIEANYGSWNDFTDEDLQKILEEDGYSKMMFELQGKIDSLEKNAQELPLLKDTSVNSTRKLSGFYLNNISINKIVKQFPESMQEGVLGLLNNLASKFEVVALCDCGDLCSRTQFYRGSWQKEVAKIFDIDVPVDEDNLKQVDDLFWGNLVIGDNSNFIDNRKKLKEREDVYKKELKEARDRKAEENKIKEIEEKIKKDREAFDPSI